LELNEKKSWDSYQDILQKSSIKIDQAARRFRGEVFRRYQNGIPFEDALESSFRDLKVADEIRDSVKTAMIQSTLAGYGIDLDATISPVQRKVLENTLTKRPWDTSGLSLSNLTTGASKEALNGIKSNVSRAIRQKEIADKLALDLYEGYGYGTKIINGKRIKGKYGDFVEANLVNKQEIHQSLDKMARLRIDGELIPGVDKKVKALRRATQTLRTAPLKAAYNELLDAVESGSKRKVEDAIRTAVFEKTRYAAKRIAFTETERAAHLGRMARVENDPQCVGFRFRLSPLHDIYDICDLLAKADSGAGPGVYSKVNAPVLPIHPFGQSRLMPIYGLEPIKQSKEELNQGLFKAMNQDLSAGKPMEKVMPKGGLVQLKSGYLPKVYNNPAFASPSQQLKQVYFFDASETLKDVATANPGKRYFEPKSYDQIIEQGERDLNRVLRKVPAMKYFKGKYGDYLNEDFPKEIPIEDEKLVLRISHKRTFPGQLKEFERIRDKLSVAGSRAVSEAFMDQLKDQMQHNDLLSKIGMGNHSTKIQDFSTILSQELSQHKSKAKEVENFYSAFLSGKMNPAGLVTKIKKSPVKLQSSYSQKTKIIEWDVDDVDALVHEYTHHIQFQLPKEQYDRSVKIATTFIKKNMKEIEVKYYKGIEILPNGQKKAIVQKVVVAKDGFVTNYTGCIYPWEVMPDGKGGVVINDKEFKANEFFTEGVRNLFLNPTNLILNHREHFLLTRAFLSGEF